MKVNVAVEYSIQRLRIKDAEKAQITQCILGYTPPQSHYEKLRYLAFRVYQAVASLFGASAWDRSLNLLTHTLISRSVSLVTEAHLQPEKEHSFRAQMQRTAHALSKLLLEDLLLCQKLNLPLSHVENKFDIEAIFAGAVKDSLDKSRV